MLDKTPEIKQFIENQIFFLLVKPNVLVLYTASVYSPSATKINTATVY